MDCFCGCGTKLRRGQTEATLQAGRIALELLAWDKARAAGRLGPPAADDAERVMERGADCYQRLLRSLHGEPGAYSLEEGERWLDNSHGERRERAYMTEKGGLFKQDKLILSEEDMDRLDRRHPERSFSGAPSGVAGAPDAGAADAAGAAVDVAGQLERLATLHAEGVLTDAEFAAAKARVANGTARPR